MSNLSVVWDSYKTHISNGLSHLQHNADFVDMTLVAEEHLVKVHRNVIALASPYLGEILKSVPCTHPVLFLNDIPHDILCLLLEYVYSGAALVPPDKVTRFMEVARKLQILGLKEAPADVVKDTSTEGENIQHKNTTIKTMPKLYKTIPRSKISQFRIVQKGQLNNDQCSYSLGDQTTNAQQYDLAPIPATATSLQVLDPNMQMTNYVDLTSSNALLSNANSFSLKEPILSLSTQNTKSDLNFPITDVQVASMPVIDIDGQIVDYPATNEYPPEVAKNEAPAIHYNITLDENGQSSINLLQNPTNNLQEAVKPNLPNSCSSATKIQAKSSVPKYTLTLRGQLQMVLNRYMYNTHHASQVAPARRRWRCVDYRRGGCQAFVDTDGDSIVARKNFHRHGYHDDKIEQKAQKHLFFTSLQQAERAAHEEQDIRQRALTNLKEIHASADTADNNT